MSDASRMLLLERLVRAHQAALRAYAFARLGQAEAAEDLVQEVFLDAYRNLDVFDSKREALPWLMGIARNKLHEYWRRTKVREGRPGLEAVLTERLLARDERDAGLIEERLHALRACLEGLPEKARELVRLGYREGLDSNQMAQRLERSAEAVRIALHRVRKQLRECIQARLKERTA